MDTSLENTSAEGQQVVEDFDFSGIDDIIEGEEGKAKESDSEAQPIEGELLTAREIAEVQATSSVGMLDGVFRIFGNDKYGDDVYEDGKRNLSPAFARSGFKIPMFEYVQAAMWVAMRIVKSMKELKHNSEDSEKQGEPHAKP